MFFLRPRFLITVGTVWFALLLTAFPADTTELSGESEKYSATCRLVDGKLNTIIVNKVSGHRVSTGIKTRATKLTRFGFKIQRIGSSFMEKSEAEGIFGLTSMPNVPPTLIESTT